MTSSRVVGVMLDPRQQSLETDLRSAGLPEFEVVSAEGLTAEFLPPDALPQYERKARAGNSIISAPYTERSKAAAGAYCEEARGLRRAGCPQCRTEWLPSQPR